MKFIFFVLIISICFSGCGSRLKSLVWNNISEIADFVVCGEVDDISISLMCGRREMTYSLDGIATELIPYAIVTVVVPDNTHIENIRCTLFVGVNKYTGEMVKNPYNDSWVTDIKTVVDYNENISIDIYLNDNKHSTKLERIDSEWVVSANDVIEDILIDKYRDQISCFIDDGEFVGEVFVKLINDDKYTRMYYYYVSIQGIDGSVMSLLVSPKTAEVLASNMVESVV